MFLAHVKAKREGHTNTTPLFLRCPTWRCPQSNSLAAGEAVHRGASSICVFSLPLATTPCSLQGPSHLFFAVMPSCLHFRNQLCKLRPAGASPHLAVLPLWPALPCPLNPLQAQGPQHHKGSLAFISSFSPNNAGSVLLQCASQTKSPFA